MFTPRGTVRAALLVDDLRRMLTDLPEISRRVLPLYYLEERSLEETAQALGERLERHRTQALTG